MAVDDLIKAFGAFNDGLKEYAVHQGISQATDQLAQLNQQAISENDKKTQQMALANQLSAHLVGLGANGTQVQQAAAAFRPQVYASSQEAYSMGDTATADKMQAFEHKPQVEQQDRQFKQQSSEALKNRQHEIAMEKMKLTAQALRDMQKDPKLKAGEVSFDTNISMGLDFTKQLKNAVERNGTWESGWFGNKEDSATLKAIPYQLAITYAKIVDPDSVAREGEVAAAQKYLIDLGLFTNKKAALAQLTHMEDTIQKYASTRRTLSGLDGKSPNKRTSASSDQPPQLPALPDGWKIEVQRVGGKPTRVLVGPDGKARGVPPGM